MPKYIELHTCSAFSFLEGSSTPEELAQEAARLGYPSLALLDQGGVYGAPRFYRACREVGVRPIVGSEITLREGCLPVLVQSREGYQNLCHLITDSKLDAEKGEGETTLEELEQYSSGLVCLTGGDKGPLPALMKQGSLHALNFLKRLKQVWGDKNVYVEVQRHFDREQESRNQMLAGLANQLNLPLLATNGVRYARSSGRLLHDVLTCIKHRTNLDEA